MGKRQQDYEGENLCNAIDDHATRLADRILDDELYLVLFMAAAINGLCADGAANPSYVANHAFEIARKSLTKLVDYLQEDEK